MAGPISAQRLFTAATGNVTSVAPGAIVITSAIGATPTVNIQGSADGVNFFNIPYALVATPSTFTAITITTAVTTTYLLQPNQPWQFVRLVTTANTNVTLDAVAYL
jgi:hypothetical protein